MRVAVLPTGCTEWRGLARALRRRFPEHEIYSVPREEELVFAGFTASRLRVDTTVGAADELVSRAAQEALGDRHVKPADLVLILDDLELVNQDQPGVVVEVMRRSVQRHLDTLDHVKIRERTAAVLRERVSFHLAAPMIEAWLLADPAALATLGVTSPCLPPELDPEAFVTADPGYLAATVDDCPTLCALPEARRRRHSPKWLGQQRARHPKGYLQWRCLAPNERNCTRYDEVRMGAEALAGLRWEALLARPADQLAHLRAMLEDLEEVLGVVGEPIASGACTSITARPQEHVLRNL